MIASLVSIFVKGLKDSMKVNHQNNIFMDFNFNFSSSTDVSNPKALCVRLIV